MQNHKQQDIPTNFDEAPRPAGMAETQRLSMNLLPTDEMREAKLWVEQILVPPTPVSDLLAMHGWLAPSGQLFACGWEKHNELTTVLGFKHESEIEQAGFCKLTQLRWLVEPRYCENGLQAAQWETIERWYERNKFPDEHFQRLCALA